MNEQQSKFSIDYMLVFLVILLAIISLVSLYTVQPTLPSKYEGYNFPLRQLQWYIAGSMIIVVTMLIDYDRFRKITWLIYPVGIIPLLMIFFRFPESLIVEFNNIARGVSFPLIGNIQPSEFMKVILILTIAHVIVKHNEKFIVHTVKSDLLLLLKIGLVAAPPMGLIALQPDLGSVLVLVSIVGCMILVSGIKWRVIFSMVAAGLLGVAGVIAAWALFPGTIGAFLEDSVFKHVRGRFYGWLNPDQYSESGFQLIKTMQAIGSGRFFGKGINNMEVYVPERHTDMILTAIGEQFGFIGISVLIIIYFLLIYRLLHIALSSNDQYGSYLVCGIIGMFTYQIFQNIGMSIQLLPITGLPLPFISYGGSSTLSYLSAIAIALNVHSRTKKYMFEED